MGRPAQVKTDKSKLNQVTLLNRKRKTESEKSEYLRILLQAPK
jgi:hypothetical protein